MSTLFSEQTIHPAGQPTLLLPPPKDLFTRRKERLRRLSHEHSLGSWLNYLAAISEAQQAALGKLAAESFDWLDARQLVSIPVAPAMFAKIAASYELLAAKAAQASETRSGTETTARVQSLSPEKLEQAVKRCLLLAHAQTEAAGRDLTDLVVAAAMQVVWTAAAQHLVVTDLNPANSEFCPVCACAAVGSILLAGAGKAGLRYQQCCLCASRWNVVRAHCTLCDEGSTVHYLSLDGANQAIGAETCDHCHGYAKIFFQDRDPDVDPVADDLATLALDVLVGEEGFGRAAPNLFLCEGEAS